MTALSEGREEVLAGYLSIACKEREPGCHRTSGAVVYGRAADCLLLTGSGTTHDGDSIGDLQIVPADHGRDRVAVKPPSLAGGISVSRFGFSVERRKPITIKAVSHLKDEFLNFKRACRSHDFLIDIGSILPYVLETCLREKSIPRKPGERFRIFSAVCRATSQFFA
jgi:hypothetical protein